MRAVSQPVRKKDAMSLVTGKPVYMDDVINHEKLPDRQSPAHPHANAIVESVQKTAAEKVPGIEQSIPGRMCPGSGLQWPDRRIRNPAPMTA